jgi:hypothetical protein
MAKETKTIDWNTSLAARGLFTLAAEHYRKCRDYEIALGELLGIDDGNGYLGCMSDELYSGSPDFDRGLKRSDIKASPPPQSKRRQR